MSKVIIFGKIMLRFRLLTKAGCAVGIGSSLAGQKILEGKDWKTLTGLARNFISAVQLARQKQATI